MVVIMIVRVVMVVAVIVVVAVIMVVIIMIVIVAGVIFVVVLNHGLQFRVTHGFIGDFCLGNEEINNFLLKHRATQFDERVGILAVMVKDLLFLTRELASTGHQSLLQLLLIYLDAFFFAQSS